MKFRFCVIVLALLVSGSVFAKVTEEETFSYPLNDGGRFSISNVNGSITITGGSGDSVEIIATKKADSQKELDEIEIEISHSADEIVVETELGDSEKWYSRGNNSSSGHVKYEVIVPVNTELDTIETVNGGVTVNGVSGSVVAESVNGSVEVNDLNGNASLSTVNGSVKAEFSTLGGEQNVKAETVNGRVTIILPKTADVRISADTLNGSINGRDFGLETDKGFVGSDLNGNIGDGSARLNIDTVNGSIKIKSN